MVDLVDRELFEPEWQVQPVRDLERVVSRIIQDGAVRAFHSRARGIRVVICVVD